MIFDKKFMKALEEAIEKNLRFQGVEEAPGHVVIYDILNTEPVCVIYSKFHPYAKKVILEALAKHEKEVNRMQRTLKALKKT